MEENNRKRLAIGRTAAFAAMLALITTAAAPVDGGAAEVESARAALERMVEVRRLLSQEKRDWVLGREILADRIEIVKRELDSFRGRIAEANESIAEADKKRLELVAENERLKAASAKLVQMVEGLEGRTQRLAARLPEPLVEKIERLTQRMPEPGKETKLSLSERFLNIVGILNESNRFNREITATSEVRALGDERTSEVTALYVGLGQAYYATASGDAAGVGTASEQGWVWKPKNEAAEAIATAISILNGERPPAFVQLPIRVE